MCLLNIGSNLQNYFGVVGAAFTGGKYVGLGFAGGLLLTTTDGFGL